jgi:hypothetical protein
VPIGSYRFAIESGDGWVISAGGDCCTRMIGGKTFEVGTITLREP